MVTESLYYIGYANLEDNVHTALQVKTKTKTHLAALLQRPHVQVHLLVLKRIQIVLSCLLTIYGSNLCGLVLVVIYYAAETHVEEADDRKQDCD